MLHEPPWVSMHSPCHQMITQQWPKGAHGLLEVTPKVRIFSQPKLA